MSEEIHIEDGVPFIMPANKVLHMECCKCGLEHFCLLKALPTGEVEVTVSARNIAVKPRTLDLNVEFLP